MCHWESCSDVATPTSAQECLTGLLPYDEDDSYENFAQQLEHLEDQANHIETVLPPKLDAAHDLQSVLGATVIGLQRAGEKLPKILAHLWAVDLYYLFDENR